MNTPRRLSGTTLTELLIMLSVIGIVLGIGGTVLSGALNRIATMAARDALAASISRARTIALAHGGASVLIELNEGRVEVRPADQPRVLGSQHLRSTYGVTLSVDGSQVETISLRFDALGIGRMSNRTIRIRRGSAESGLTVSSYGRVRRW